MGNFRWSFRRYVSSAQTERLSVIGNNATEQTANTDSCLSLFCSWSANLISHARPARIATYTCVPQTVLFAADEVARRSCGQRTNLGTISACGGSRPLRSAPAPDGAWRQGHPHDACTAAPVLNSLLSSTATHLRCSYQQRTHRLSVQHTRSPR
jgi:hypothetical protein